MKQTENFSSISDINKEDDKFKECAQLNDEASTLFYDAISNIGVEKFLEIVDSCEKIKKYLTVTQQKHLKIKDFIEKFDVLFYNSKKKITELISELIEINIAQDFVKTSIKAKKIIKSYEKVIESNDTQTLMFLYDDIKKILENNYYFQNGNYDDKLFLQDVKKKIYDRFLEIITSSLKTKKHSITETAYILISDKSFETQLLKIFEDWVEDFYFQFIQTINNLNFSKFRNYIQESISFFNLINELDINIINIDPSFFIDRHFYDSYTTRLCSMIHESLKEKIDSFFNDRSTYDTILESNYIKFYHGFTVIDNYFTSKKITSQKEHFKNIISERFHIKYLNLISKSFNNFLSSIFDQSINLSTFYSELKALVDNFLESLVFTSEFDPYLCEELFERFHQFSDVFCSRIYKIKLEEYNTHNQIMIAYVMISILHEFLIKSLKDHTSILIILKNSSVYLTEIITNCRSYLSNILCEPIKQITELPVKLISSDYLQLPRYQYNKINVSNIVIDIRNTIQNWSNINRDLILKSHNFQKDILDDIFCRLSTSVIQASMIIKFKNSKHREYIKNDNNGIAKVWESISEEHLVIRNHKIISNFLKLKTEEINKDVIDGLKNLGLDETLAVFCLLNNEEKDEIYLSKFTNIYELYFWLSLHNSKEKRKELIRELLNEYRTKYYILDSCFPEIFTPNNK